MRRRLSGLMLSSLLRRTPLGACFARDVLFPWTRGLPSGCQPSPKINGLGVRIALFEACSTFTRVTACTLPELL